MGQAGKFQVVDLVHAMYDTSADNDAWMSDVSERLYAFLDIGAGCIAYRFDHRHGASVTSNVQVVDGPEGWRRLPGAFLDASTPAFRRQMHSQLVPLTAREIFSPSMWEALAPSSAPDGISLQCLTPAIDTTRGVQFFAASPKPVHMPDARRDLLGHLMSHWVCANRLRLGLEPNTELLADGQAIVDPTNGRVVHASEPFQQRAGLRRLREMARQADQARAEAVSQSDAHATDLSTWTALSEGRWSLVDRFDTDGRRFLVVVENAPKVGDPRALSEREQVIAAYACLGYANKAIAYHLGVDNSAISRGLRSVMRKLGVESREALIATYARVFDRPNQDKDAAPAQPRSGP